MIKNINMRNCATYNGTGASLSDCKKINFIYGANGSGKTTISKFLQNPSMDSFADCNIEWDSNDREKIYVYNRTFREENFRQTDIQGVFTIGHASIEEHNELDLLKAELDNRLKERNEALNSLQKKKEAKLDKENKFKKDIWELIFKKYDPTFSEAFAGLRNNKEKFYEHAITRFSKYKDNQHTEEELQKRAKTLFGNRPESCDAIVFSGDCFIEEINKIVDDELWGTVIVGSDDVEIGKLIHSLNNNDWVLKGKQYLTNESDICPFCQQHTITASFREQLNNFFDVTFNEQFASVETLEQRYNNNVADLLNALSLVTSNVNIIKTGDFDKAKFENVVNDIRQKHINNQTLIKEKLNEPGRKISLNSFRTQFDEIRKIILECNRNIETHNNLVEHFKDEHTILVNDIWLYILKENKQLFSSYKSDIKNIDKAIEGLSTKDKSLETCIEGKKLEIEEKNKNFTSVQPTIDEINRTLKAYGFNNFMIAPSTSVENSYQIQREDGSIATNTLSEGEETFISFLYFMQQQKGAINPNEVSERKILVLDDPISSLDSTILYIVSAMVKDLANDVIHGNSDVSQLFVLTHNVFFHKEASFIDGKPNNQNGNINYWMVSKDINVSTIKSFGMVNPISTSYELLWQELRESSGSSLVTIQNIMRRIIENYFRMLGKGKDAFIQAQFDSVEEQLICKSLFHWINDGSHMITDDLYIDPYTDSIERYRDVFHKIFIKTNNEAHYNMMMGLLTD